MATIPATSTKAGVPTIGFIAHVDTSPEMPGAGVKPIVHRAYDGRDLVLPDDPSAVLRLAEHPALARTDRPRHRHRLRHDAARRRQQGGRRGDRHGGGASRWPIPRFPTGRSGSRSRLTRRSAAGRCTSTSQRFGARLRLHDRRRRPRRDRDRELFGRRDDGHLSRLQHASRLRQGTAGQCHQGRGGLHRCAAAPTTLSPETTDGRDGFVHPYIVDASVDRTTVKVLDPRLRERPAAREGGAARTPGARGGRRATRDHAPRSPSPSRIAT